MDTWARGQAPTQQPKRQRPATARPGRPRVSRGPADLALTGDTAEQIEGLRMRTLDLSVAGFSHTSQLVPDLGLFSAPFLFEDDAHFARVFDGEVGQILDRACRERYGIRLLGTFTSGYRLLFNGRRPVNSAEDLSLRLTDLLAKIRAARTTP